jgi:hypothetical protein
MYGQTHLLGTTIKTAGATGAAASLGVTGLTAGGRVLLAVGLLTAVFALTTVWRTLGRRAEHQRP